MSAAKHTPGPWRASKRTTAGTTRWWVAKSGERLGHFPDEAAAQAKADLLNAMVVEAAAPDMLAALRQVESVLLPASGEERAAYEAVCAAIAKATGSA